MSASVVSSWLGVVGRLLVCSFVLVMSLPVVAQVTPDVESDKVGAIAGELRVDESGAATYSIPIYAVPGTAGVTPQLSLAYSSQGGDGPLGRGWSVAGLSAITRCRATLEAGDGTDGGPITFSTSDRFCLDGQRLLPAPGGAPACPIVTGLTATQFRTELESFQRVCAYKSASGDASPRFFSIERTDGSVSFYGDRNGWDGGSTPPTTAARSDGYVETNASGKTSEALSWVQTRFRDSTGNYIDYVYLENPGSTAAPGEHLISAVKYTGKVVLDGQTGSALAPYAEIRFVYATWTSAVGTAKNYSAGGVHSQSRYVSRIDSLSGTTVVRSYLPTYGTTASGANHRRITSIKECTDTAGTLCLPATTFTWSTGKHEFATAETGDTSTGPDFKGMVSSRMGDVDGDGRQDIVWFKNVEDATCTRSRLFVAFGELIGSGSTAKLTFSQPTQTGYCTARKVADIEDSWHLLDYNGDGKDDLLIAGAAGGIWSLFAGAGRTSAPFTTSTNIISALAIPVPSENYRLAQLADLDGNGLLDIVYPKSNGGLVARIYDRASAAWGAERTLVTNAASGDAPLLECDQALAICMDANLTKKGGSVQLNDFNGDGRADALFTTVVVKENGTCLQNAARQQLWDTAGIEVIDGATGRPERNGRLPAQANVRRRMHSFASPQLQAQLEAQAACTTTTSYVVAYTVSGLTASTVTLTSYAKWTKDTLDDNGLRFGDLNADGLTDLVRKDKNSGAWFSEVNSGRGYLPAVQIASSLPSTDHVQLVDVTGDGRADVAYPSGSSADSQKFKMRPALRAGGFGPEAYVSGTGAQGCESGTCSLATYRHLFGDFDADGVLDFLRFDVTATRKFFASRATGRFAPRDTITKITNGLGAITELYYLPLTNGAVYRRDSNSRTLNYGRGSPVHDFLASMYVVARARSSAPTYASATALSAIYYRYAGAKIQAGGRGFLGFREIQTFDDNMAAVTGKDMAVVTSYRQDFPYIGRPQQTVKRALASSFTVGSCFSTPETGTCFTPTTAFPALTGTLLSDSGQVYSSSPAFAAGTQAPLFVRTDGTTDQQYDLANGSQLSKAVSTFIYGSYGNVSSTTVDTYQGTSTVRLHTVTTSNTFAADDASTWRLGRLSGSTVTHTRGIESTTRSTSFTYESTGAKTGLLTSEKIQPGGGSAQELKTFFTLDAFGNRTHAYTCSNSITDEVCKSTSLTFQPSLNTTVHRYTRTTYDSLGRFPTAVYAPIWNGTNATEWATQTIVSRNLLGDVTQARDLNGVDVLAVFGNFGRPYYSWTETTPTVTPGTAADGGESWTTYRFCGTAANQVSCPTGAKFRRQVETKGGATGWTYFDVLGRPLLEAKQSFQTTDNQGFSAVCTYFDAASRSARVSEPMFLASVSADTAPSFSSAPSPCVNALWTTQSYDAIGRPTQTVHPDLTTTTLSYSGLTTATTDQLTHSQSETRNALGELASATDPAGLTATYAYYPDGGLKSVTRSSGRGNIVSSFGYDALGRKTSQTDPDSGSWLYTYNAAGELIEQSDASGNKTVNDFDARGRVWRSRVYSPLGSVESTSTFVFDTAANGKGALASETISGISALSRLYAYDTLGRLRQRDSVIDGKTYREATQYDALARAYKVQDATGRWAKTEYTPRGYAVRVCDSSAADTTAACSSTTFHLQIEATDPRGNVLSERRGNSSGPATIRTFDSIFGRLQSVCTGAACSLQSDYYQFDSKGNLILRERNLASPAGTAEHYYKERFQYDAADRLTLGWNESYQNATYSANPPIVDTNVAPPSNLTFYAEYDKLGNLCRKTSWSTIDTWTTYSYAGAAGCGLNGTGGSGTTSVSLGHKLASLNVPLYGFSLSIGHDANGNQVSAGDGTVAGTKTYTYSGKHQAISIYEGSSSAPSKRVQFWYGPDGGRYKRVDDGSQQASATKIYIGGVEREIVGATVKWTRPVAGVVLQQFTGDTLSGGVTTATSAGAAYHLFFDHLGSTALWVSVSGSSVTVVNRLDFAPHGEARPIGLVRLASPARTTVPWRGFTGHEHIDSLSTIHMNGRIYDPLLGRFLQPDPVIQTPGNPQNWNPYTYVLNNPLSFTDPSGHNFFKKYWRQIVAIAVTYFTAGAASGWATVWLQGTALAGNTVAIGAIAGGISGFAGGVVATGTFKGGVQGAFSGAVFGGLGGHYGSKVTTGRVIASGMAGGVLSELQGGKFGHGFISAGVSTAAAPHVPQSNLAAGTAVSAVIGGSVSALTGGKFANGAVTGAFSFALGRLAQRAAQATSGEPSDAIDQFKRNRLLAKNFKVSCASGGCDVTASFRIGADMSVTDDTFAFALADIKQWNGTYLMGDEIYRFHVNLTIDHVNPEIVVGSTFETGKNGFQVAGASGFGAGRTFSLGNYRTTTAAHEFGHLIGLGHRMNFTQSIMSYATPSRFVYPPDIAALAKGYK